MGKDMGAVIIASLRMVADLGDPDKVAAVLPGGVCERLFSPHRTDQVAAYMSGEKLYWWFSQEALERHARHALRLAQANGGHRQAAGRPSGEPRGRPPGR